ncbi:MAG: dipeptide epimerase [Lachnospiraceae bacterium]|nr:dipeptide epimerase [Lachnospiraceae bacterium]
MKIAEIRTAEIDIPLRTPFKTALRTVESVHDVLIQVTSDTGEKGYGEAPPTAVITGETIGSIRTAVDEIIAPTLTGMEIENLDGIMNRLEKCMVKNTSAKAAVDMAVYDLYSKACGKPLYQLLGGAKKELETDITISVNPVEEMVRDSLEAVSRGFRILKVKVGKGDQTDVERMKAIRAAVGKDIVLRVDANQGWEAKQAVRLIRAMEDALVAPELVEQPVKAHDLDGMRLITASVETPVLADESLFSAKDALTLLQTHAADLLNIKLMKTGGIWQALKICSIAEIYGVECMLGCMLESKLAVSAAVHLAAGRSIVTRADLDGPALCRVDPYPGGPVYDGPRITLNDTPGIGVDAGFAF